MRGTSIRDLGKKLDRGLSARWGLVFGLAVLLAATVWFTVDWFFDLDDNPRLDLREVPDHGDGFSDALFQNLGVDMQPGHAVEVIHDGAVFDALERDIAGAQASIHVLVYIWEDGTASDRMVEAITARARAGVQCRVVVDAFGSPDFDEDVALDLEAAGCEVRSLRPDAEIARSHRKIVVIDGRVAFTGGFGVRDEWLGTGRSEDEWRDIAVRVAGPAARDAQHGFAESWLEAGGQLLPASAIAAVAPAGPARAAFVTSAGAPMFTRADRLTQLLIAAATERLWIANAYFVPSEAIRDQLVAKAIAGVDVRVLTAGEKSDSKTSWSLQNVNYDELTDYGVRVWEYQPGMMHAKTMVVDRDVALVGTINLDPLSLRELDEDAVVIDHGPTNEELARAFLADCEYAEEQE